MKSLGIDELKTIIIASLLIVIGVLFCCSLAMGISGLSVIIGLILIILGTLFLLNSAFNGSGLLGHLGLAGIALVAFGIMFITNSLAGIIFSYIPWFLIVLGVVVITDALLGKFLRGENNLLDFIIKLVIGGVSLGLGICLMLIEGFMEYSSIILGVLMVVYGIYIIFAKFTKTRNTQSA